MTIGGAGADLPLPVRAERLAERVLEALGAPVASEPAATPRPRRDADPRARILVAEDSEVNRMLMLRQLERLGIAADVVTNGREAIDAVARRDYPLILMDLRMPELDGFDATRAIRAAETGGHVPIVAVTANAARADREACLAAGMDDHLEQAGDARVAAPRDRAAGCRPAATRPTRGRRPGPAARHHRRARSTSSPTSSAGASAVAPLVRRWDDELPGRVAALEQAAAAGDGAELRRVAHTLRGATEIFGGTQVAGACTALELAAAGELDRRATRRRSSRSSSGRAREARTAMLAWLDAA